MKKWKNIATTLHDGKSPTRKKIRDAQRALTILDLKIYRILTFLSLG